MLRRSIAVSLLLASCAALSYPRYDFVFSDPESFDVLYSSAAGPLNETWYFNRRVNLTAVVLPAQIVNYWTTDAGRAGFWNKSAYAEDLEVRLYQHTQGSAAPPLQVGSGGFLGNATSGQELRVPLVATDAAGVARAGGAPPTAGVYSSAFSGYHYTVSVAFRKVGLYPWYLARSFSTLSPLTTAGNQQGFVIGLSYVLL